ELDAAANRLARLLIAHGAGPERYVAVSLPRSADWMITLWAITRTGAAWVPVDPNYPPERIAFMVGDSGARLLVTDTESAASGDVADDRDPGRDLHTVILDDPATDAARKALPHGPIRAGELDGPTSVDHP
ncbi:amino acid adenylation domain-containing protein, partial [Streptomyces sp. SID10244]|nr:amino acid adenylation domain-containing protein [Streptomyces sp. SID10244]